MQFIGFNYFYSFAFRSIADMIMLFFIFTLLFPFCSTRGPPNKRYNNQPPKFSKFPSVIYVYENTTYDDWNPTVLEKIEISTETFDTSQPFNLKVIKGNEIVNVRKFNPRTYNIILKSKLDRELQDEFTITFELSYLEHKLTRSSILFVKDSNDEHPKFTNLPGSVKVMENTKNQNIFKIKAIDKDLGLNSVVKYRLNNFKDLFGIMEDGSVYLKQSLDYETCTKYNLKIIASDIGGLESVSNLIVNVIDSNDETPIFLVQPYVVKIKEHTEIGKKVVQIQAIDGDTGINNTIHYKIENDESQKVNTGIFKIHPENGWIYVNKDIEVDMKQINTTVVAFEVDSPLIFSKTNVYFEIIDINNNAPRFNVKKEIVGYIQENSKTNTKISWKFDDINFFNPLKFSQTLDKKTNESYYNNVYVTDWDHGKNSEILVSINSNSKMIPFKVITSQLQNKRSMFKVDLYLIENAYIDYENIKMYEFSLVAREKNTQEHYQDEIKVVIHVTDLNDIWPTFSKFSYHVKIKENSKPGTFVANVTANDGDFLDKNGMSYNITKNHGNTFEINNFGAVQITSNNVDILNYYLDYETTPIIYLIIYVYDGVNHSAKCQLVIELIDTNDNPPIPIKFNFMMHIPENTLEIPVIPKLMAIDKDAHPFNIVNYKITLTQKLLESNFKCSNNNFHIDRLTGTLSLLKKLDAEKCRNHNIVVFLYNPDNHLQNSTISIQVLVSDVNDNRPYFDKKVYNYQTNEALFGEVNDVFRRQLIINTHAIDKDVESPNNNIFYKIVDIYYGSVKQDNTIFKIDTNTGVVSLFNSANLDFEISGPTIDINVVAYDGGVPSLSNNTIVRIHVADINDNTPYFDNNNVNIELRENLRYTTSIGACFAVDRDSDSNLEYTLDQIKSIKNDDNDDNITSISNKTESKYSPFELNPVNCKIFLKGTLDHESVSEYKLTIKVVDKSGLDQEATTIVNVKVLDENDNWPVLTDPFVKSSRKYTRKKSFDAFYNIHVPETTKIGTIVGKIQAYDLDSNDVLKYHLINNISHVSVDDSNGSIRLKKSLDREKLSFLILNVKVEDLVGHAVYGNYSILIDDENDNAPIWELLDDFISVSEEYPIFKPFYKVTATDKDVDVYGKIIYRIKEPLDASESDLKSSYVLFGIKQETGQIYLKQSADAEIKTIYKMHVEALDNAGMEPYNLISKLLYINIKDFNDERPIFKEKYHERMYHVMNYSPIGFKVMKVEATDNDATIPNNEISYYFEQSISNSSYFFIIDRRTGIISLSESLQNFRKTVYLRMYIIAIDNGEIPLSAKTSVLIKIFQRERVNFSLLSDETNISISIPEYNLVDLLSTYFCYSYSLIHVTTFQFFKRSENLVLGDILMQKWSRGNQHPSMIYQFKVKPIFENMKIYYSLRNYQNYSVSDKFEIESNTGKLFSLKKFDHEYKTEYWIIKNY
ncbi:Cadherin-related family member 1 [Intoshia linei]|uniref:Cadherin-related family member 1 n=1 Tax=Intoshia linei TaxID=1819745 RepID=A0A177AYP2_9BILA|nr:Cadherin-related family member 1 [Intoshia linei]